MSPESQNASIPVICRWLRNPAEPPADKIKTFTCIADVLQWEENLRIEMFGTNACDRLKEIWFRGTRKPFPLAPGIYRDEINTLANDTTWDWSVENMPSGVSASTIEVKRLNIEREMILAFERESGPLWQHESEQELYFLARHHGMPTRLLDWSINPLIALFMCVFPEPKPLARRGTANQEDQEDGVIYAMDPEKLDPPGYICQQYDPMVEEAIEVVTMWKNDSYKQRGNPTILPIRPHTLVGRVDRKQSRFTLHSFGAKAQENKTLRLCQVSKDFKEKIRCQLERIGVNEFSVYYTLDRLVLDITERFSKHQVKTK